MKIALIGALVALSIPFAAQAQTAPTPTPKAEKKECCCEKMKRDGKDCCADMKGEHKAGADAHAGHDMSGMDHK